jgi:hypothetical protein
MNLLLNNFISGTSASIAAARTLIFENNPAIPYVKSYPEGGMIVDDVVKLELMVLDNDGR